MRASVFDVSRGYRVFGLVALALVAACGSTENAPDDRPTLTRSELLDPETCASCHQNHYQQWSKSMHAYAAKDPVFLAMNARGQEETKGALGTFCVNCHAPMAVREGLTTDGLNLAQISEEYLGVTCYFCHNAKSVAGTHNNPIELDDDNPLTLRGGIPDPVRTNAHRSEASDLLTSSKGASANLCGSCHDIVLPSPPAPTSANGEPIALERTFQEWKDSVFAPGKDERIPEGVTCGGCHLPPPPGMAEGEAASRSGRTRRLHDHVMAGVDRELHPEGEGPVPDLNGQQSQDLLDTTLRVAALCVEYPMPVEDRDRVRVWVDLDNVSAGHAWPSGASQDRRAWVDLRVYYDDELLFSSGKSDVGSDVLALKDPNLFLFRDVTKKEDGSPAHMFWDVAELTPGTISEPRSLIVGSPDYDKTHAVQNYPRSPTSWIELAGPYDEKRLRVEVRVRIQAVGYDVLDDLIASGHLEERFRHMIRDTTLLPNKTLARPELVARTPDLARFREITFEWSPLTLNSAYFLKAFKKPMGTTELYCAGMNRPQ